MDPFERIVEERIREAEAADWLREVEGKGRPLPPGDDLAAVPAELRAAYRLLHQAGYLPEEMELRKEAARLEDLIAACAAGAERDELTRRHRAALLRYHLLMERRGPGGVGRGWARGEYRSQLARRLGL